MIRYKMLTGNQVCYDVSRDASCSLVEGLEFQHADGWELVTTYQHGGVVPFVSTSPVVTMFIFRKEEP